MQHMNILTCNNFSLLKYQLGPLPAIACHVPFPLLRHLALSHRHTVNFGVERVKVQSGERPLAAAIVTKEEGPMRSKFEVVVDCDEMADDVVLEVEGELVGGRVVAGVVDRVVEGCHRTTCVSEHNWKVIKHWISRISISRIRNFVYAQMYTRNSLGFHAGTIASHSEL